LFAPLLAQTAPRAGRVVNAAGEGVAATVYVRTVRPCGLDADDVPPLRTAADGTFVLPPEVGAHFAAFALTADTASAIVERRGDGPLELALGAAAPKPLQVDGLAAWRDEGPLRAFVLLPVSFQWRLPVALDGRGAGTLPPLPPGDALLELRTAADGVLWRQRLLPGFARLVVAVPEPVLVKLHTVDASGVPVAGAQVFHEQDLCFDTRAAPFAVAPEWQHRELGRTDAKGNLAVRLPRASGDGPLDAAAFDGALRIVHENHAAAHIAWHGTKLDGGEAGTGGALDVTLADASPFEVTLRFGDKPFAHRRVQLFARVSDVEQVAEGFAFRTSAWHGVAETDAEGKATWPAFPAGATELRLVPIAQPGERLPGCIALHGVPGQEVALDAARTVVVHVRNAAGAGIAGVLVVAMPSPPDLMVLEGYGCEPRTVTDAKGRAEFVLPAARFWIVAANRDGFAHMLLGPVEDAPSPTEVALAWRPFATWDVRVERGGEAVPGAHFVLGGSHWIDGAPIPPEQELLPLQWLGQFDWLLVGAGSADANGRLRVRYAPTGVSTTRGRVRGPGPGAKSTSEIALGAGELPARVELR
jgi:hypothetical protein